ncbi:MAG TPA: response regulator transcription factor, partial [Terriglobales bacterium]|nr:response regulator transcription factor [Terriglobales bacterium]
MESSLRIIIADDHALFRQGLISLLKLNGKVTVVGEAERLDDLLAMLEHVRCDVLLLDLGMERNSLVDIETLAKRVPAVVVVTANEQPADAADAIRSGARAVVFKRFAVETLMSAIEAAVQGQVWMPPSVQSHTVENLRQGAR